MLRAHYSYRDIINIRKTDIDKTEQIWEQIKSGKSFWDTAWKLFISRDIDRKKMKDFLMKGYRESSNSFKQLTKKMNIEEKDYHKFMSLIRKYALNPKS